MAVASRPAGPDDAILGVAPAEVLLPASLEECAEAMGALAARRARVGFVGARTAIELGAAPSGLDALVSTERLARIVEHAPADLVLTAEAGTPLARVQEVARAHGQTLALDPPFGERATLGGLVATGAYGPRRARHGAVRDLILGVTLVRADGVVARGGGKVVKNVAGFDLPRLVCGALGTLGLVTSATFRLHPLPEVTVTRAVRGLSAAAVVEWVQAARAAQLEPRALVALRAGAGYDLGVTVEGFERGVAAEVERLAALGVSDAATDLGPRHDALRAGPPLRARLASLPTRLPAVDVLVAPALAALDGGGFAWYPTLGLGFLAGAVGDLGPLCAALTAARAALAAAGGSLVLDAAPAAVRAELDPWGPPPSSLGLMTAVKRRFDPDGRLNPGRFVGGL
jgi:glycolate oxidase FAD binding subunit